MLILPAWGTEVRLKQFHIYPTLFYGMNLDHDPALTKKVEVSVLISSEILDVIGDADKLKSKQENDVTYQ